MTLRSHLVFLVLATLIPVLVFSSLMILLVAREEQAAAEVALRDTVRAVGMAVDRELASAIHTLDALGTSESLDAGDLAAFYRQADRVLKARPDWTTVALFEPTGRQLLNLRAPLGAALPRPRDGVEEVVRTRRPVVSNLFTGQVTGQQALGVAVPVVREGRVRYVLGASFDPAGLSRLLTQHQLPSDGVASIIDRNHVVVARSRDAARLVGQPANPAFVTRLRTAAAGTFKGPSRDGVMQYVAYTPSLVSGWTVSLGIPAASVDAGLRQNLGYIVGGALLLLGLSLALALVFGRRIAGGIVSLTGAADALGRGQGLPPARRASVAEVAAVQRAIRDAARLLHERDAERQRAEADLRRASVAKDEFLAMLGHELRNPVGAIRIAVKVLDGAGPEAEESTRARGIIDRQSRHLARLVDDLLDVSRVTSGKVTLARQAVDLKEIGERCVESLRQAGRLEEHHVSVEAQSAVVDGDPTRLEQVLTNLLENAVKYTPAGGGVRLSVAREDADAVVRVRDEGVGIEPAMLSRIFDLFAQGERSLDRAGGGLGLGLTLVRRLTELHGGSVEAFSAGRGRGSEFVVRLPVVAAAPVPTAAPPPPRPAATVPRRRVLVIEDNPDVRDALRVLLEQWGHRVEAAASGAQGVATALAAPPDLALIDIGLPGFDGYAVARQLRAAPSGKQIFLVALTGYGQPEDRRRALEAGFDAHLVKPVEEGPLLAVLARPERAAA